MTIPLQAAFIALGMQNPDKGGLETFNLALESWGQGHLELTIAAIHYAELALKLMEAGYRVVHDYPGVGEYEISETFGAWYVLEVIDMGGELPEHTSCCFKLTNIAYDFFKSACERPGDTITPNQLHRALSAVAWPEPPRI